MNEAPLLGSKHSLSVGRCMKWRIARCYDADALLKVRPASWNPDAKKRSCHSCRLCLSSAHA
jgi:hypothetical protein